MGRGRAVHMGTRAQAFSAKIKSLRELQHKVERPTVKAEKKKLESEITCVCTGQQWSGPSSNRDRLVEQLSLVFDLSSFHTQRCSKPHVQDDKVYISNIPNIPRTSTCLERTANNISPDRESWIAKDSASIRTSITRSSMTPSMSSFLTSGLSTLPSMLAVSHFVFLVLNKNGSCNSL